MKNLFFGIGLTNPKPNVLKNLQNNYFFFLKKYQSSWKNSPNIILNQLDISKVLYVIFFLVHKIGKFYLNTNIPRNFIMSSDIFAKLSRKILKKFHATKKFSYRNYLSPLQKRYFYIFKKFNYVWEKYYLKLERDIFSNEGDNLLEHSNYLNNQLLRLKFFKAWGYVVKFNKQRKHKARRYPKLKHIKFKYTKYTNKVITQQLVHTSITDMDKNNIIYYPITNLIYQTFFKNKNILIEYPQPIKYKYRLRSQVYLWYREAKYSRQRKLYYAYYLHKTFKRVYNLYWLSNFYEVVLEKYKTFTSNLSFSLKWVLKTRPLRLSVDYLEVFKQHEINVEFWEQPENLSLSITTTNPKNYLGLFYSLNKDVDIIFGSSLKSSYIKPTTLETFFKGFWGRVDTNINLDLKILHSILTDSLLWDPIMNYKTSGLGLNVLSEGEVRWELPFYTLMLALYPGVYISEADAYKTKKKLEIIFELVALLRERKSLYEHLVVECDLFYKIYIGDHMPNFNPNPKNVKFRQPNLRKRNFKKSVLIPGRRIRRIRKKMFSFFFMHSLSNEVSFFSKFFFNIENSFFLKNNFFKNSLLNTNFDGFESLDLVVNKNINFLEKKPHMLYSRHKIKNFNFSNYNPISFLPYFFRKNLFKKKHLGQNTLNNKYIQFYLNGFVSFWTSTKSFFLLQSNHNLPNKGFTNSLISLTSESIFYFNKIHVKFFRRFPVSKFVEFFTFSMFRKDLNYFVKFLKYFVEETPLKDHKKIFSSFEFMLKKFLYKILLWTKTKGIKFEVAGKISVTGNSKKRRKIVKLGYYSLTHKKLKIDYLLDTIRTSTGVLGFRMFMTY